MVVKKLPNKSRCLFSRSRIQRVARTFVFCGKQLRTGRVSREKFNRMHMFITLYYSKGIRPALAADIYERLHMEVGCGSVAYVD